MHWSAPGDDGRAGYRGGRVRLGRWAVGLSGDRVRGGARAVGLGTEAAGSGGGSVASPPGQVPGVPGDAGVAAGQCAAAPGGRGDGDRRGAVGQGRWQRASPDRGGAGCADFDGAGLVAADRRGRRSGVGGAGGGRALLGTEFTPPAVTAGPVAAVVELLGALAAAVARRLGGSCSPWRLAAVLTGGRLLSPGGPGWAWGGRGVATPTRSGRPIRNPVGCADRPALGGPEGERRPA